MSGKPSQLRYITVTAEISSVFMDITFVLIRLWSIDYANSNKLLCDVSRSGVQGEGNRG